MQVSVVAFVFRPLELLFPLEKPDPKAVSIDRSYTLLKLLALVPLFTYLVLAPLSHLVGGTGESDAPLQLERLLPWLGQRPVLLFFIYFAVYDLTLYAIHRLQHAVPAWWMLHSLHHSQRHLNCWTNDRDSFLDDVFEAVIFAFVAMLVGTSPNEYAGVVLIGQLLENFSHTNIALGFGNVFGKVLVSPSYHRLHHMLDDPAYPDRHNCNFGFVFPLWDILFGTALYHEPVRPCGVRDPLIDADNKLGLWAQQWAAVKRFSLVLMRGVPVNA
ncbi:MAG TPA: sterol desaturase family protein [Burkholderiales bacterium]|nr:sterol desaturase family protein [Burkholderiales bacterium]